MAVVIPERATSRYAGHYAQAFDPKRLLDIFTDSESIALSSKNPGTARERLELAVELYHQLQSMGLPPDLRTSLHSAMEALVERFPSQVCLNEAIGLCDKARKLKTPSRRLECFTRALEVLSSGLATGVVPSAAIQAFHDQVVGDVAELERLPANPR
jgi:hypothetical protein